MAATEFMAAVRVTGFILTTCMLMMNASTDQSLVFSGTTRQNATGHWLVMTTIKHKGKRPRSDGDQEAALWTYDVEFRNLFRDCQPLLQTTIIVTVSPHPNYKDQSCVGEMSPMMPLATRPDESNYHGEGATIAPLPDYNTVRSSATRLPPRSDDEHHRGVRTSATPLTVPAGYKKYDGVGYYKMHVVITNWSSAKEICEEEGAHLAIINSKEEEYIIGKLAAETSWAYVFIGFQSIDGEFRTVRGDPLSSIGYVNWVDGEPPNDNVGDCGIMGSSGKIDFSFCNWPRPFICELLL